MVDLDVSRGTSSKLKWAEADTIRASLRRSRGHLGQTAKDLGISRTTLWRKMNKYSISPHEYRA
jgi:transcriptional regulator of acetoin/glycerol metabolism